MSNWEKPVRARRVIAHDPLERSPLPSRAAPKAPRYENPPWPTVWRTTIRVFFRRWFGHGRLPTGILVVVLVGSLAAVVVAGYLVLAPADTDVGAAPNRRPAAANPDPVAAAASVRSAAADWIAANVTTGVLACDTATCRELDARGYPVSALVPLNADGGDVRNADLVAVTATVRIQLGRNLRELVALQPLAVFGSGPEAIEIRAVTPAGPEVYQKRVAADRRDRRIAGQQLAGSAGLELSDTARTQLESGRVDARILIVLPALLADHTLAVRKFSASPEEVPGAPLRIVEIDRIDGVDVTVNGGATRVIQFLDAQWPPFLPAGSRVVDGAGSDVLEITYSAPSPIGLLGTGAGQ